MSDYASPSDRTDTGLATSLVSVTAAAAKEALILGLAAVWAVMWVALSLETLQNQGRLEGAIIAAYSLAPVVFVVGWRLQAHTAFELPGLADLSDAEGEEPGGTAEAGAVADRYTAGERE